MNISRQQLLQHLETQVNLIVPNEPRNGDVTVTFADGTMIRGSTADGDFMSTVVHAFPPCACGIGCERCLFTGAQVYALHSAPIRDIINVSYLRGVE